MNDIPGHKLYAPLHHSLDEYVDALSGVGPLAYQWSDKPHRLIYDLVKALRPKPPVIAEQQTGAK